MPHSVSRIGRGILRRPQRESRPIFAGAFSRLLALAIDAGVVYGSLLLITAAIAALVNAFSAGDQQAGTQRVDSSCFDEHTVARPWFK